MDYNKIQKDYNQHGYCIIRDVIDPKLAMEIIKHVKWLEKKTQILGLKHFIIICL